MKTSTSYQIIVASVAKGLVVGTLTIPKKKEQEEWSDEGGAFITELPIEIA